MPWTELPYERLSRGDVGVGLAPHTAVGDDAAVGHGLFRSLVEFRVAPAEHQVQVRLALVELVLAIFLDER